MRRIRLTLNFLLLIIWSAIRQRPITVPHAGRGPSAMITSTGLYMPTMAGGDETPEEKAAREETERKAADEEAQKAEEERKAAEAAEAAGEWDGDVDKKRAERAVRNARAAEKAAIERAQKAEADATELRQAQETAQEKTTRERDEAKATAERERSAREHTLIDLAIRDAAADADVPAKKVRRLLKLIDREGIAVGDDNEVSGAEDAVEDFLDEFPEFKPAEPGPGSDPTSEPPGGAPDRKRARKELTAEQIQKMAKEDPDQFNRLFDEGKIPKSALEGVKS